MEKESISESTNGWIDVQTRREERERGETKEHHPIGSLSCFGLEINRGHQQSSLLEVGWVRVPTLYCTWNVPPGTRGNTWPRTDYGQDRERKADRTLGSQWNFLVEFVGSIKVLKGNQTKNSARMSMQCMLYSVGGFICQPRKRWHLRFYVHPSLAEP